jgi:elongation factor Tu
MGSSRIGHLDGAILVISAVDGPMPQTRRQLHLAKKAGIRSVAVFIDKIDLTDDPELVELVELETREVLNQEGFEGDAAVVIRGSALLALGGLRDDIGKNTIIKLISALDASGTKEK